MAHRPDSLVILKRVEDRTNVQKDMFITILENVHTVSVAIRLSGLSKDTVYRWRREDENFAERWEDAITFSGEILETAVYHKLAKEVTSNKPLSMPTERLAEFMLAGMKPDKYKQRSSIDIDVTQLNITIDWTTIPDEIVSKFNANQLTLQDVYDWSLQHQKQKEPTPSED